MKSSTAVGAGIAATLREKRREKGWSLDKTSVETGVSKAMLGQIERQESSPTIATLWKIATGLDCSFSSFISRPSENHNLPVMRRETDFTKDPNMKVATLFAYSPVTRIETFEITLTNYHKQVSSAHHIGVLEHLYVIEGKLVVFEDGVRHEIASGEQFQLKADRPHTYEDASGTTRFIDIIFYP